MLYWGCDMGLLIGRKASTGPVWGAWCLEMIPPLSLPLRCCHMPVWYEHMVGNTLLLLCLFICVPVNLSFLSLCVYPLCLSPLSLQSICCPKHPEYLSACVSAFLSNRSSKRKGTGQHTFPAPLWTQTHIQKGIWYLSPASLQLMKDAKFKGRGIFFQETRSGPQGLPH